MRRPGFRASLVLAASLVVMGGALSGAPAAQAKAPDLPQIPGLCVGPYSRGIQWNADVSRVATDRVVTFDRVSVPLTKKGWAAYRPQDPAWTLWFHSLSWLANLAIDDSATAVDVLVESAKALPDPGRGAGKQALQSTGWTEGAARNRLNTANCLYDLTGDKRIIPVVEELVAVNMDPRRYPGLPYFAVQNHGAMANISLMQAGRTFGRQDWIDYAGKRMKRDLPEVFSSCGMMWEQSSTYQDHNIEQWLKATRVMNIDLSSAEAALAALVRPDGVLEAIGDGQPMADMVPSGKRLWCADSGWAANTLEGSHYTLRFGPALHDHGHLDHGSMTWFAGGVPVLSDRGLYDKGMGKRRTFAQGMAAHSVFEPDGHPDYDAQTIAKRLAPDSYRLSDDADGLSRTRTVTFGPDSLVVVDSAMGTRRWTQHWQLAPGWTPTPTGAVYTDGTRLTLDCPKIKPLKVEAFTAWRTSETAWDLRCPVEASSNWEAAQISTTLTVTAATDDSTG